MNIIVTLKDIGITGLVDILVMTMFLYALLVWFRRSKMLFVLIGILIIGGIYVLARQFNLFLTTYVFQAFFAVILIALIVIFQEDLKHLFEQIAIWSLNRGRSRKKIVRLGRPEVETLVRTVTDLAKDNIGALIVLRGHDMIDRHLVGGVDLNGELSEPLLKSLFDPHSIGHDGAVVIEQDRIVQFSTHLPLSKDIKKIGRGGTRHAAALGIAELTDAMCLVVSEEQGTVSVAHKNEIEAVNDPDKLSLQLQRFYQESYPLTTNSFFKDLLKKNIRELTMAFGITLLMWFIFIYEASLTFKKYGVPVGLANVSAKLRADKIEPNEVSVTFSGRKSAFYFVSTHQMSITLNMLEMEEGSHSRAIQETDLIYPKDLNIESISPQRIKIILSPRSHPVEKKADAP